MLLRSHDGQELMICELSGPPYANDLEHFGDDKIKIQKGMKDMLNIIAHRAKHGDVKIFRRMKVFGLQVFGWKAFIYAMDVSHKHLYRFEKMTTFNIPRLPEDLPLLPLMIHTLISLKSWVDQSVSVLEELSMSSIRNSRKSTITPESSPLLFISKTLDTPEKPKKLKHSALA